MNTKTKKPILFVLLALLVSLCLTTAAAFAEDEEPLTAPSNLAWNEKWVNQGGWNASQPETAVYGYNTTLGFVDKDGGTHEIESGPSDSSGKAINKDFKEFMTAEGLYSFSVMAVADGNSGYTNSERVWSEQKQFYRVDIDVVTEDAEGEPLEKKGGLLYFDWMDGSEQKGNKDGEYLVYPDGAKMAFHTEPYTGYTFEGFTFEGEEPANKTVNGTNLSFDLDKSVKFTAVFKKNDEKSAVSVDFGSKHTDFAQTALTAITTLEEYEYDDYGFLEASLEGSVLTIQFPKTSAKESDARDYVADVLYDLLEPAGFMDQGERLVGDYVVGNHAIEYYDDEGEIFVEGDRAKKKDLGSSLSLNVLWETKITSAEFTVAAPLCGTNIEVKEIIGGGYTLNEQTPTPKVSYDESSKLTVDMMRAQWLNKHVYNPFDINRYDNWFEGTVAAGEGYNAAFNVTPIFGYFVDENDMPEISVNGDKDQTTAMYYNGDCVVQADVKAIHDWGNGKVTIWPIPTTPGEMTYKCKNHDNCGGEKTKEIPAGAKVNFVTVNVKTLDDEGKEDTSATGGAVIPSQALFMPGDKLTFNVDVADGYTVHSIKPEEDSEDIDGEYTGSTLIITIPDDYAGGDFELTVEFAPKCDVYIDFGEGNEGYALAFIKYLQNEYGGENIKQDPEKPYRAVLEVSAAHTKGTLANMLDSIAYDLKNERKNYSFYNWLNLLGFGEKEDAGKYSSRAEWEAEKDDTAFLREGVTYYSLWNEEIEKVDVTIQPPKCGESNKFADPYAPYSSQTNPPKATLKSTEQYDFVTGDRFKTAWVKEGGAGIEPAEYDFKIGEKYRAEIQLEPRFGYMFTDETEYTFNGEPVDEYNIAGPDELELIGDIAVTEHTWDEGTVTKEATIAAEGQREYKCRNFDVCGGHYEEAIPALNPSGTPKAKMTAKGKKKLAISWNKIQGVEGYDIYLAKNKGKAKIVKSIKGNKTFKWTKSGLKKKTVYKAYVKAYYYDNGKKTYVKTTPTVYAYTGNVKGKYTNAKSVSIKNVKKGKLTLKKGKTFKIKAKVKKVKKKKKLMPKKYAPTLRYLTTNSKVATVTKGGKITAKAGGTCTIYVYAHNGVSKSIKVTVK